MRIAPEYAQPTVHVLDASRVVGVVGDAARPRARRATLDAENRVEQERLRALHAERERKPLLPIRAARERRTPIDWHADDLAVPEFTGTRLVEPSLAELRPYIDWTFFFHAWELKGRYPAILEHPEKALRRGICSRTPAPCSTGSSPRACSLPAACTASGGRRRRRRRRAGDRRRRAAVRFPMLRQQARHDDTRPNRSLADFVAPAETGLADHVGGVRGRRSTAPTSSPRRSRPTATTTTRSW